MQSKDKVFVCIGSGPSLTLEDCRFVESLDVELVAVNRSAALVSRGHAYIGDLSYWKVTADANKALKNRTVWTHSPTVASTHNVHLFRGLPGSWNSGQKAIELAAHLGATKIVLIGYDCSLKNGIHWHGSHKLINPTLRDPVARGVIKWQQEFAQVLTSVKVPITNCSRYTELTCFTQKILEEELSSLPQVHLLKTF